MTDLGINEDYVEWRYTIAVGDERGRALTVVADDGPQQSCLDPTWSPDGNWIMFQRGSDGKLAVIAADGSRQHLFGRGFQFFATPDWDRRTA